MGDKKEGSDIGSEHSLLAGAGILFLCMAVQKAHAWISHWQCKKAASARDDLAIQ